MGAVNFIALTIYAAATNFYLYELFWGDLEMRINKGFYYLTSALFIIYLTAAEVKKYNCNIEYQSNIICKLAIAANLMIFAFTQLDLLPKPITYLFLLNGCIFAISVIILLSGIKYGTFKD